MEVKHLMDIDKFLYLDLYDGASAYVHIPDNVNENTPVIVHAYGAGGGADETWAKTGKLSLDQNAICIFPKYDHSGYEQEWSNMTDEALNQLIEEYDIPINKNNIIQSGHSGSGTVSVNATAEYIRKNNITEPQTVVIEDSTVGYWFTYGENLETLKENQTTVIAFCQPGNKVDQLESLAKRTGLNLVIIEELDNYQGSWDERHCIEAYNLFDKDKGRIEYLSGNGNLLVGDKGYRIKMYSGSELVYQNIDPHDISAIINMNAIKERFGIETYTYIGIDPNTSEKIVQLKMLTTEQVTNLSFSINNSELDTNLRNVLTKIGSTSYLNNSASLSVESTSKTVSKIADLITNYFKINTDLLFHIANEMKEFTKIAPEFIAAEKEAEKKALELNDLTKIDAETTTSTQIENKKNEITDVSTTLESNAKPTITPESDSKIESLNTKPQEEKPTPQSEKKPQTENIASQPENKPQTTKPQEEKPTPQSEKKPQTTKPQTENIASQPENKPQTTKPQEEKPTPQSEKKPQTTKPQEEKPTPQPENKPQTTKPQGEKPTPQPENKPQTTKPQEEKPTPQPENKPQTTKPQEEKPNNTKPNIDNNNNFSNQIESNPTEKFPEYTEVYSDKTRIVYDYNNEYRIIVHNNGDEIIGFEHYYKFDNETEAMNALNELKLKYSNNPNIENIIQKGQYIKVVFDDDIYENLTITDIRKQYSQLNEIIKL